MDSFKLSKLNLVGLTVFLLALQSSFTFLNGQAQTLRGITVSRPPFVERRNKDSPFQGYYVDLLDQLAIIGRFNYTLNELSIATNAEREKAWVLNEIQMGNADFAIADFLDKPDKRYNDNRYSVEFTDAYQTSGLSALIRKDQKEQSKIKKFEDLIKKTTGKDGKDIEFGTLRLIYNKYSTFKPNDEIYQRMRMTHNLIVDNREAGIERTLKDPYTFIQETINNELAIDEHCELTQLALQADNKQDGIQFEYAIAVKRGSPFLDIFNNGLRELKSTGKLQELKQKYWNRKCNGAFSLQQYRYYLTGFSTLFSLALSLFLLS